MSTSSEQFTLPQTRSAEMFVLLNARIRVNNSAYYILQSQILKCKERSSIGHLCSSCGSRFCHPPSYKFEHLPQLHKLSFHCFCSHLLLLPLPSYPFAGRGSLHRCGTVPFSLPAAPGSQLSTPVPHPPQQGPTSPSLHTT